MKRKNLINLCLRSTFSNKSSVLRWEFYFISFFCGISLYGKRWDKKNKKNTYVHTHSTLFLRNHSRNTPQCVHLCSILLMPRARAITVQWRRCRQRQRRRWRRWWLYYITYDVCRTKYRKNNNNIGGSEKKKKRRKMIIIEIPMCVYVYAWRRGVRQQRLKLNAT